MKMKLMCRPERGANRSTAWVNDNHTREGGMDSSG